jgi:hypothetical protein
VADDGQAVALDFPFFWLYSSTALNVPPGGTTDVKDLIRKLGFTSNLCLLHPRIKRKRQKNNGIRGFMKLL